MIIRGEYGGNWIQGLVSPFRRKNNIRNIDRDRHSVHGVDFISSQINEGFRIGLRIGGGGTYRRIAGLFD